MSGENNKVKHLSVSYFILLIIILLLIYVSYNIMQGKKFDSNIEAPVQGVTSGARVKTINGVNVILNFVATYEITGRVVDIEEYKEQPDEINDGYSMLNLVSPKDIGISWGELAITKNHRKVKWSSSGDRHLKATYKDKYWVNKMGGINEIQKYWSNNHLIPSDNKTSKLINEIKIGDYINIEGYLVNLICELTPIKHIKYATSTTRTDTGSGACEVIYVTKITWIDK